MSIRDGLTAKAPDLLPENFYPRIHLLSVNLRPMNHAVGEFTGSDKGVASLVLDTFANPRDTIFNLVRSRLEVLAGRFETLSKPGIGCPLLVVIGERMMTARECRFQFIDRIRGTTFDRIGQIRKLEDGTI